MIAVPPHPREVFDFQGEAESEFVHAIERGRLHHAWLLAGPEGVGKATFAYRAARRLLGATPSPSHGLLGASPDDPVSRLVASRAHPDLIVLQRDAEEGKSRKQIPVDEARGLPEFFAKTPAIAAWRVAIIDAADDLNASGANALLKTLEEPPARGVILMVCHRPGVLLTTLRSRCRTLWFAPPSLESTAAWLATRTGAASADAARISAMARGAPGQAWRMTTLSATAVDDAARDLLAALPTPDPATMLAMADGFRGPDGADRFSLLCARLASRIREMTDTELGAGRVVGLNAWAEVWAYVSGLPPSVEAVNLDRGDAFFSALARLKSAAC